MVTGMEMCPIYLSILLLVHAFDRIDHFNSRTRWTFSESQDITRCSVLEINAFFRFHSCTYISVGFHVDTLMEDPHIKLIKTLSLMCTPLLNPIFTFNSVQSKDPRNVRSIVFWSWFYWDWSNQIFMTLKIARYIV